MMRHTVASAVLAVLLAVPAAAQRDLALAPGADGNDWEAYFDLGMSLIRTEPNLAERAFQMAAKIDPSRAEPLFALYVSFWMRKPYQDLIAYRDGNAVMWARPEVRAADSLFSLALQRNPFVHRGLEIVLYDRMPGRFRTDRTTRAWIAYSAANFKEAIRILSPAIQRDPAETIWQRYDRALSRVGDGDFAAAAGDIQFILDELRRQESEAEELRYYRSKHALLYMIGLIRVQQRDFSGAREAFGEALVENAGFAHAQAALGLLSRTERNIAQALEEHTAAAALMPNDPVIQIQHAQALLDANRFDAAVDVAERVARAEPLWAAPHLIMGRARERQRRSSESLGHYRAYVSRATRADPQAQALRPRLEAQSP